jgi:sugar lactone lactonase YvrE
MHGRFVGVVAAAALVALGVAPAAAGSSGQGPEGAYQVKEMIRGASIHGANGLAIDADGRLLVASVFGGELVAVDTRTGAITDRLGHDVGVDGPDDVALGPDGSVYWTDILAGEVGRLAPDGTTTKQAVAAGVNPIAFTGDGRLFVGQAFFGDGLYELDPALVDPPRTVIPDSGIPPFAAQLNGFDFGADGMLYAPQPFLGRIVRIDPDSGALWPVVEGQPFTASVEFDASGRLFANQDDGRVVTVDIDAGTVDAVATIRGASSLDNMVFDAKGRLFVSDAHSGAVYVIAEGRGVRTLVKGGLMLPGGLAVMRGTADAESLFVADVWRLMEFDARSGRLVDIDPHSFLGPMIQPWSVAPDGGNLILTYGGGNVAQVWDPRTEEAVETFTDFLFPFNAIRFGGDLVVAELGTGSVVAQDDNGTRTTLLSGLYVPRGLAATDTDLWVADWATGLIHQVAGDGAPRVLASGLSFPEGMAVDRDGSLLIVESGAGRLTRIDPATGASSTVADGLAMEAQGPAALASIGAEMSDVAVDSTGTIFVSAAGADDSAIYRISAVPAR